MKGRHQFRRRFSLQPSFLKEESEPDRQQNSRSPGSEDAESLEKNDTIGPPSGSYVRHKIVVMGAAKVGKSSIITQFLYSTFSPKYKRTVEEMHHGDFNVNGVHLTLDILDTAGSFDFPAMRALSISSADAFVLVYDVTDSSTFEEARTLRDLIHETKGTSSVPIVVVGNKIDLMGNREVTIIEEMRTISAYQSCREDVWLLCNWTKSYGGYRKVCPSEKGWTYSCLEGKRSKIDTATTESVVTVDWENGFVETSAKENQNVSKVFKELLLQAKLKYNLSPALRRKRRQSLPLQSGVPPSTPSHSSAMVPSAVQLQHLQNIRDRHGKRNSCVLS